MSPPDGRRRVRTGGRNEQGTGEPPAGIKGGYDYEKVHRNEAGGGGARLAAAGAEVGAAEDMKAPARRCPRRRSPRLRSAATEDGGGTETGNVYLEKSISD